MLSFVTLISFLLGTFVAIVFKNYDCVDTKPYLNVFIFKAFLGDEVVVVRVNEPTCALELLLVSIAGFLLEPFVKWLTRCAITA